MLPMCMNIVHILCISYALSAAHLLLCKDPYNFLISQITQPLTNDEKILECWQKSVYKFVIGFIQSHFLSVVCYSD